jgi:hypothetical protein
MERFNLKKLNKVEGKGQDHVEISNRFTALESLGSEVNISRARETMERISKFQPKKCRLL